MPMPSAPLISTIGRMGMYLRQVSLFIYCIAVCSLSMEGLTQMSLQMFANVSLREGRCTHLRLLYAATMCTVSTSLLQSLSPTHCAADSAERPPLCDACAPERLNVLALLVQVLQQRVIRLVEDMPRGRCQPREDVTRAGRVLAALQPRPELTCATARVQST